MLVVETIAKIRLANFQDKKSINRIPPEISTWLFHAAGNAHFYLLPVNIFRIGAGCIMNGAAAVVIFTAIIFTAILVPAEESIGIDPMLSA